MEIKLRVQIPHIDKTANVAIKEGTTFRSLKKFLCVSCFSRLGDSRTLGKLQYRVWQHIFILQRKRIGWKQCHWYQFKFQRQDLLECEKHEQLKQADPSPDRLHRQSAMHTPSSYEWQVVRCQATASSTSLIDFPHGCRTYTRSLPSTSRYSTRTANYKIIWRLLKVMFFHPPRSLSLVIMYAGYPSELILCCRMTPFWIKPSRISSVLLVVFVIKLVLVFVIDIVVLLARIFFSYYFDWLGTNSFM